jgi:predicted amidophosphoribosyltransferase
MITINTEIPTNDQEAQELEVCISCLKTNDPGTHFCDHCGTPLTSFAATAPLESIRAEGDLWRKAVSQGRWGRPAKVLIVAFLMLMILGFLLGIFVPW